MHKNPEPVTVDLRGWFRWTRRSRLEPFKKLAATIKERFDSVVPGMVDHCSNAYVEAINSLQQQARGFRMAANFSAIAYLRMSKLKHLPVPLLHPVVCSTRSDSKP